MDTQREQLVKEGLLRCSVLDNLRIYNYTDKCVHSSSWDDITRNSRGIIIDTVTDEIVARPMPKFFNMGECEESLESNLPWNDGYVIFEKLDGWLGTLYRYNGQHRVATRGSFDGMGVALWTTKYLNDKFDLTNLPNEVTLVFEIICPQTRIIVNYGDKEELILLTAYNRHTGKEYAWPQVKIWANEFNFTLPRIFKNLDECYKQINTSSGVNLEGFVIRFNNGLRVKIKGIDYKRRASILSSLTPLGIWKAMRDKTLKDDYVVDSDYIAIFEKIKQDLKNKYNELFNEIQEEFDDISFLELTDRKYFAQEVKSGIYKHPNMMFALLDGHKKSLHKYIIKLIRPTQNVLEM